MTFLKNLMSLLHYKKTTYHIIKPLLGKEDFVLLGGYFICLAAILLYYIMLVLKLEKLDNIQGLKLEKSRKNWMREM